MKIFLAGATGAIGRRLLPLLLRDGHEVIALVRTVARAEALQSMGARVSIADALDREALTAAVRKARPEAILHELT
ncbi:MAG TPA: NAD(P)H-binding protein, partial [Candidatus Polarisedimenticolia bacterium]|nr:NAD(P)H-binding protein [Candidatus Polarisedimenticolia bacterium]